MAAFDQPLIPEIKNLIEFCKNHKKIYLVAPPQASSEYYTKGIHDKELLATDCPESNCGNMIQKFLKFCHIKCEIFSVETLPKNKSMRIFRKSIGYIVPYSSDLTNIISNLIKLKCTELFLISEYNTRTINYKMTPRKVENFWLEVNLADHCDLNCQCCDHFSPIASKTFLDPSEYRRDIHRLSQLTNGKIGIMKLQGGEPLLNENINDIVRATREEFPESTIWLFTAGIRLLKWETNPAGNLWQTLKECNVQIELTRYPIPLDYDKILEKAEEYGVKIRTNNNVGDRDFQGVKFSVKHPFDLDGKQELYRFISCYQFNEVPVLRHGKIYPCPMTAYIEHFNNHFKQNLQLSEEDAIDLYKVNTFEEIAEFCTHRVPFCRYCAVQCRHGLPWARSNKSIDEYTLTTNEVSE